ncbi:MAG TPA: DUF2339 domain-containing protein [Chitinophagaceae bacterium]|nr:DUF2339 domain-containing protein [Chitinophagaceae bacterium]
MRKQIDALASEMRDQQQRLLRLHQELNRLQNKKPGSIPPPTGKPSQNFRFENFIGLRVIHFVGIILLVIGLSIGVKYVIDRQLISESMRISLAYAAGIILYSLSWRLKKNYQLFSAILFSGAMASLYFTTYAAFVYYGFFSFAVTFLIMVGLTIYTAFESIRYDRQEIAVLGMVGAYGIPFLISANNGRADLFFSYIIFINVGISFLSFKKKWKMMGWLALLISWILFISWGSLKYEEKDFWTGFILMGILYLLFTVNVLAYRVVRSESLTMGEIQQLIINNLALYVSSLIVFGYGEFGTHLASTTGCVALGMILLALLSYLFFKTENILQQSLAMQAVVLVTMFIGFYWNGFFVTILWVAFSVVLFGWGIISHRSWPRLAAILLMIVTLGKLVIFDSSKFSPIQKITGYLIIGALLLILSFFYQKTMVSRIKTDENESSNMLNGEQNA